MSAGIVLYAVTLLLAAAGGVEEDIKLCAGISDVEQRLACYDALARRSPQPAASAPGNAGKFGLPPVQTEKDSEATSIRSRLLGEFRGWEPGVLFTLENGQIWKCTSDDRTFYADVPANPEIIITKSYFGAYWMEIIAIGRKVKVKRVK